MNQPVARNVDGFAGQSGQRRPLRASLVALLSIVLTAGLSVAAPTAAQAATVQFADAQLAACIAEHLSLDPGTTSFDSSDLEGIGWLECKNRGIADLTGIEALTNLWSLDISGNKVTDISPLDGLTELTADEMHADGQVVDWRIPVGVSVKLPLVVWSSDGQILLTSSNEKLLRISETTGKVTAKKAGSYWIQAVADSFYFDVTYNVTAYTIKSFKAPQPKIFGTAAVGKTLTAIPGTWKPGTATLSYQWYRSGKKIGGATTATYELTKADLGKKITVKITGQQDEYKTATVTSKSTKKVKAGTIVAGAASISGATQVGQTVTATTDAATWTPNTVAFSYQWYRLGKPIKGAKAASYTAVAADQGKKLSVTITAKAAGYNNRAISVIAGVVGVPAP